MLRQSKTNRLLSLIRVEKDRIGLDLNYLVFNLETKKFRALKLCGNNPDYPIQTLLGEDEIWVYATDKNIFSKEDKETFCREVEYSISDAIQFKAHLESISE